MSATSPSGARLVWDQSAGEMRLDGALLSRGYAGRGRGINNPAMQDAVAVGPIPRGLWRLTALRLTGASTGPYTIVLEPAPGTDARGRSAFRIHGDNARLDRSASHGCIILPRTVREAIWRSGARLLEVVE
ncbi:tlde1 domain-containing protein [Sphingomonas sp. HMP6]|uniref:tlde1 domain-containing protein n=1 Tax=Sphingomonas sp. HMP6 TaxID=1517551 RepID=UPI0015968C21|nr:tlde1 domain-containing protein [Sphingomonas sp. HMP6]BCA60246.1 hypothetical protein HMP06_3015 [Sphingomonas sp. HMP6]